MEFDLFDPERLLRQLHSGESEDVLASPKGGYLHLDVYQSFALQRDRRSEWFECLKRLIELKAPCVSGGMTLTSAIADFQLESTPQLSRELLRRYGEAGMVDVHDPLPGQLRTSPHAVDTKGMSPLAAAVFENNVLAVELFLSLGASENLGPVHEGGPSRELYEYAHELGASRVLPFLAERAMRQAMPAAEDAIPMATRSNRRMGL